MQRERMKDKKWNTCTIDPNYSIPYFRSSKNDFLKAKVKVHKHDAGCKIGTSWSA